MPDEALVSVVTPSLNQRQFIGETVESVLAQDYPSIEYVVVDGGSRDGTVELLQAYGERLRWVSEPDSGQSAAINKGWQLCTGEIIAWLNSDDTYLPGAVASAARYLRQHPEVDVVYGECDYVDVRGSVLRRYPTRTYDYRELLRTTTNFIPQPATFIRRRAAQVAGLLDESLSYVMDYEYWLRLGLHASFAHLPVPLATSRLHPDCKTIRAFDHMGLELLPVYEGFFARADLPDSVRGMRGRALSNAHYLLADRAFWAGRVGEARDHSLAAWRACLGNLHPALPLALTGRLGWQLLSRWPGDPRGRQEIARAYASEGNDAPH